ncbi:MAG: YebC/PmpR family DNA-binding transcriptional regulator, partial [Patescibacteria group bacterium]
AFLIEAVTDNKLRTHAEIKNLFEKNGGSLAGQGAVAYMFQRIGKIRVKGKGGSMEDEVLELIDLGAEDVDELKDMQEYLVYVQSPELNTMSTKITQAGYRVELQEITMKPVSLINITDPEIAKKVLDFIEKLEELDDVQKVYDNFRD